MLFSEKVTFMSKKKSSQYISPKILQNQKRHSLAIFGSLFGEIFFFKYFSLFNVLIKNSCLKKSKFSSEFALFKYGKKNKLSEYFCARFGDCHFYG